MENGHTPEQLEAVQQAVDALASEFHEDWRKTRLDAEGNFEPRIKPTTDTAWIEKHGTDQVDIANSTYAELPSDWQEENKAAANVVVDLMVKRNGNVDLSDPAVKTEIGGVIHDAWLSRNDWSKGGDLDVPFDDLPESEQAKDLDQVKTAQRVFGTQTESQKQA